MSIKSFISGLAFIGAAISLPLFTPMASAQIGEPGFGGGTPPPPLPIVEWEKRQNANERLQAFGDNLMGDGIDPHTGTITFEHTDVSLPGNSALEVALKRRRSQGYLYHEDVDAEFADWEYVVPRIKAVSVTSKPWTGTRCTSSFSTKFSPHVTAHNNGGNWSVTTIGADGYSQGIQMDVPGHGTQQVLEAINGALWPNGATHATKDNWYLKCGSASDGGQGFIATAPNGDTYKFDKFITHRVKSLGVINGTPTTRQVYMLAATEVTDVNGNWVHYNYDGAGRLTKIDSNDGREITLNYSGSSKLVSSVSANGRQWTYAYRQSTFRLPFWEVWNYRLIHSKVLSQVTQPDSKSWNFTLDEMTSEPSPAKYCEKKHFTVTMTHPYGTSGAFTIKDMGHRFGYGHINSMTENCPEVEILPSPGFGYGGGYYATVQANSLSVTQKTLSSPTIPSAVWTYTYEQDDECPAGIGATNCNGTGTGGSGGGGTGGGGGDPDGPNCTGPYCQGNYSYNFEESNLPKPYLLADSRQSIATYLTANTALGKAFSDAYKLPNGNSLSLSDSPHEEEPTYVQTASLGSLGSGSVDVDRTNWTQVQGPNSHMTYYHEWVRESLGGKLVKKEIRKTAGSAILQTENYTYELTGNLGHTFAYSPTVARAVLPLTNQTDRDGDTYYNSNTYPSTSSSSYHYGFPTSSSVHSSVSTPPRVTTTTYAHNTNKWILGLPASITVNGRNEASYVYDGYGRKTSQTRYGYTNADFAYNSNGTMSSFTDANGNTTSASDWKRGTPQTITREDNATIEQNVDDNGWVMDTKDPNGNTATYTRDNMGRMTNYAPSGPWLPTSVNYSFGSPVVQTITHGTSVSTITYDNMFRPTLVKKGTTSPSYVKTIYNGGGQAIFTSFPSSNSNPTMGSDMTYDGLGRVISSKENVEQFAETTTAYLNTHRHAVTDPEGNTTTYWKTGYNGPGKGQILKIQQPLSVTTTMTRNPWDELLQLQQTGTGSGKSQYYEYDSHRRLCRHTTPEGRSTVYAYDPAGYLEAYAKGISTSSCVAPSGASRVDLEYDDVYRVVETNFADSGTPDIFRTYDANGNMESMNRSGVNRAYSYDSLNHLTTETLSLDGKSFPMTYTYNSNGFMVGRTLPSGRALAYAPDDIGRNETVASGGVNYASGITYHPNDVIFQMNYGNGQAFTQDLTDNLKPEHLLSLKNGTKAIDLTYTYADARGKVTQIINGITGMSGDNRTYDYDNLGRLTSSTGPWGSGSYSYDALGNILTKTEGGRALVMTYDNKNRLISHTDSGVGPARSLNYDGRGNVTTLGTQTFAYDYSDQPVTLSGAVSGTYTYDGNRKRVKSSIGGTVIYNVFDAAGKLVHIDNISTSEKTDYIAAGGKTIARLVNNVPTYLHHDALGSAQTGTSANGLVSWREQYMPFGETMSNPLSNGDKDGYTGHIRDAATGLNYMQARYYDPLLGRFLSTDPAGFTPEHPFMFNKYAYVGNDPMNATDPDGEFLNFVAKFVADVALEVAIQAISGEEINLGSAVKGAALGVLDPTKTARKIAKLGRAANKARKTRQLKRADSAKPKADTGCCFVAGTLVETDKGYTPIEDLDVGDLVLSKDVETGDVDYKAITDLIRRHERVIWDVTLINADGVSESFETTDDHPWWIPTQGWVETENLEVGMQAVRANGQAITISLVTETTRTDITYNLTVADYSTYYVGKQRVLVHNCGGDRQPESLQDQMAMAAAKDGAGGVKMKNLGDKNYEGWNKMELKVKSNQGKTTKIHYNRNPKTGETGQFKVKQSSNDKTKGGMDRRAEPVPSGESRY